jgi:hypothetical protein
MDGLTPSSVDDLPQPGELVADEPFWRIRRQAWTGKRLRICACG